MAQNPEKDPKDSPKSKPFADIFTHPMADSLKASAQQIWLAGMGAFAKAQQEGTKVFEALIKEGADWQSKTQSTAQERWGDMAEKMNAAADDMTHKAASSWDKLESIFETRTAKALARLGVPTAQHVAELSAKMDALNAAVEQLQAKFAKAAAPKTPAASKKTAARSAATRAGATPRKAAAAKKSTKAT